MPISTRSVGTPYWSTRNVTLYLGDVRACLRRLPARSVHCCVTSPPYWGLRDYGNDKSLEIGAESLADCNTRGQAQCGRCFVCSMVSVFREVHRVLRDDGTLWLNLGDTFTDGGQGMVPALVALALREDGWLLRQDIIWYALNKIPEPVTDRFVKSHEHIFLLTKSKEYYYDHVGVQESNNGRLVNKRDVWVVPTSARYPGSHSATFSPKLITPCILAGTSEHGCCAGCGKPYERVVVRVGGVVTDKQEDTNRDRSFDWSRNGKAGSGSTLDGTIALKETVGWQRTCGCKTDAVTPVVVLDPFVGSGTTVVTALELGRIGVGIDLSETYLREIAIPRIESSKVGRPETRMVPGAAPLPVRTL